MGVGEGAIALSGPKQHGRRQTAGLPPPQAVVGVPRQHL